MTAASVNRGPRWWAKPVEVADLLLSMVQSLGWASACDVAGCIECGTIATLWLNRSLSANSHGEGLAGIHGMTLSGARPHVSGGRSGESPRHR